MKYLRLFLVLAISSCLPRIETIEEEQDNVIREIPSDTQQPGHVHITYNLETELYQVQNDTNYYKNAHFFFSKTEKGFKILPKAFDLVDLSSLILSFQFHSFHVGRDIDRQKVSIDFDLTGVRNESNLYKISLSFKEGYTKAPVVLTLFQSI